MEQDCLYFEMRSC